MAGSRFYIMYRKIDMSRWHLGIVIGQKIALFIIVLWIAVSSTFVLLRLLPGDAIQAQLSQSGASEDDIVTRRHELGLDQPILIQYLAYLKNLLQGDFGTSFYSGQAIAVMILPRIGVTLQLAWWGMLVAVVLGINLGVITSLNMPILSPVSKLFINMIYSVPIFWSATLILFTLTINFNNRLFLAILVLGIHGSGEIARMMQTSLQETSRQAYVLVARAKGLTATRLFWNHKFKIALLSTIPIMALQAGFMLGGTVIIETVFNLAGIGKLLFNATLDQDYAVVQAIVIWLVTVYVLVLTVSDILLSLLDPRISTI